MKFKIGDNVVVVAYAPGAAKEIGFFPTFIVGTQLIVKEVDCNDEFLPYRAGTESESDKGIWFGERELEHTMLHKPDNPLTRRINRRTRNGQV